MKYLFIGILLMVNSAYAKKILFIGDSLTFGQMGDIPQSVTLGSEKSFVELLKKKLPQDEIINLAVPGSSTTHWLPHSKIRIEGREFFHAIKKNLPADIVHIMLGTNDSVGFFLPKAISGLNYEKNLKLIVSQIKFLSPQTQIIISKPPLRPFELDDVANTLIKSYSKIIDSIVASNENIRLGVDLQQIIRSSDYVDGDIHFTASGHQATCDELMTRVFK